MSDILFALAALAMLLLVYWLIKNDDGSAEAGRTGLFAVKADEAAKAESAAPPQQPRWRRTSSR